MFYNTIVTTHRRYSRRNVDYRSFDAGIDHIFRHRLTYSDYSSTVDVQSPKQIVHAIYINYNLRVSYERV